MKMDTFFFLLSAYFSPCRRPSLLTRHFEVTDTAHDLNFRLFIRFRYMNRFISISLTHTLTLIRLNNKLKLKETNTRLEIDHLHAHFRCKIFVCARFRFNERWHFVETSSNHHRVLDSTS